MNQEIKKSDTSSTIIAVILLIILLSALVSVIYIVKKYKGVENNTNNTVATITDYITLTPHIYESTEVFGTYDVKELSFKNLNNVLTSDFSLKQVAILSKIDEIKAKVLEKDHTNITDNIVKTNINATIIDNILTIKYELNYNLKTIEYYNSDIATINIDLSTMSLLTTTALLNKYGLESTNVGAKLFDAVISTDNLEKTVTDSETNTEISIQDIITNKDIYVTRIITSLDTLTMPYIIDNNVYVIYKNIDIEKICYNVEDYVSEYKDIQVN